MPTANKASCILVTGAGGFIGKNLISQLRNLGYSVIPYDKNHTLADLNHYCKTSDTVVHLAGVNRPENPKEFYDGNDDLTQRLCEYLAKHNNKAPIIFSSSIQAELDNDYGKSKKQAEDHIFAHAKSMHSKAYVFRFKNLYGKWSRPNYNSVVATWCYNVSRDLEIKVDNENAEVELCYIDDVVDAIISKLDAKDETGLYSVEQTDTVTLGKLRDILLGFRANRTDFHYPSQATPLHRNLWATYLNYLDTSHFSYELATRSDDRGSFTEILKDTVNGQVSVNISKPGIIKGQHWHASKSEKFLVVHGNGVIRFRDVFGTEIIEYPISAQKLEVVDIPTGYIHNVENLGNDDMVTLMWANEIFDPLRPDTYPEEV